MPSAGDIDMTHDFFLLPSSKNAASAIAKGDIVSLKAARTWAPGDKGPYGVANQAIASGADMKGKVVVDGVVWVKAIGAISQFSATTPATGTEVSGATGFADAALGSGFLCGEVSYDAAANKDDLIRIDL